MLWVDGERAGAWVYFWIAYVVEQIDVHSSCTGIVAIEVRSGRYYFLVDVDDYDAGVETATWHIHPCTMAF